MVEWLVHEQSVNTYISVLRIDPTAAGSSVRRVCLMSKGLLASDLSIGVLEQVYA